MRDNKKVVVQFPICMVLFIMFLVLKLTNVIGWSWWWVTAPLWIPLGLALAVIVVLGVISFIEITSRR